MAEKTKEVKLLNLRAHPFKTSKGHWAPGPENAMSFSEEEAKVLLGYDGIHDASQYVVKAPEVEALKSKIAELEKKLEAANARIAELEDESEGKGGKGKGGK